MWVEKLTRDRRCSDTEKGRLSSCQMCKTEYRSLSKLLRTIFITTLYDWSSHDHVLSLSLEDNKNLLGDFISTSWTGYSQDIPRLAAKFEQRPFSPRIQRVSRCCMYPVLGLCFQVNLDSRQIRCLWSADICVNGYWDRISTCISCFSWSLLRRYASQRRIFFRYGWEAVM